MAEIATHLAKIETELRDALNHHDASSLRAAVLERIDNVFQSGRCFAIVNVSSATRVNIRSGVGTSHSILGVLEPGQALQSTIVVYKDSKAQEWRSVQYKDRTAYVASYLDAITHREYECGQPLPTPAPAPPPVVSVPGGKLTFKPFTGCNMRGLAWYPTGVLPYANQQDMATQLDEAKRLGFSVVRFYAAHNSANVDVSIPLVRSALDMLQARGLKALLTLTDCAHSGFHIWDTSDNRPSEGYSHKFYAGGWRERYAPFVQKLLSVVGKHPALYIVSIGNEMRTPFPQGTVDITTQQADNILYFFRDASNLIRQHTPALIATGLESAHHVFIHHRAYSGGYAKRLYALPNIDIATAHTYEMKNPPHHALGSSWQHLQEELKLTGHPLILEEMGLQPTSKDAGFYQNLVAQTRSRVQGYMQWGMMATNRDIGDGDTSGMIKTRDNNLPGHLWEPLTRFWQGLAVSIK